MENYAKDRFLYKVFTIFCLELFSSIRKFVYQGELSALFDMNSQFQ